RRSTNMHDDEGPALVHTHEGSIRLVGVDQREAKLQGPPVCSASARTPGECSCCRCSFCWPSAWSMARYAQCRTRVNMEHGTGTTITEGQTGTNGTGCNVY